ncbi:MAG: sugar ABC transporter ATP-binding protein [Oscillospiraceae bacterium]|jgi:ribose transport system ATP-binding protein|nr:sugar ABC transporter ATP-binding protein [Oscillospiraceae bacterium]
MNKPILTMDGISKAFAGVRALKDARFDLMRGEVHALMGENGAGKSTLMKILTGIYARDEGTITFEGRPVMFKNPREAQAAGIVIVHQELNMLNHLTVAQNVFIGREPMRGKVIDDTKMNRDAHVLFQKLGIDIDPKATMGSLTIGRQQMCEIAKAISTEASVIVFDEPTAALTDSEIEELFKTILDLRSRGIGIVYISHRMDEIKRITDRVTVMRDGECVGALTTAHCTKDDVVRMMVGRAVYEDPKNRSEIPADAPVVLSVRRLRAGSLVKDVSFDLRRGEILGLSGLMGAGRTETARAIFGADKPDGGEIFVNGRPCRIHSPRDAVAAGIGYLSEDRKRYGLLVEKDIAANITLASLRDFMKGLSLNRSKEDRAARRHIETLRIKTPSEHQEVRKLSGGNQQKIVIGKWLTRDSQILIFDEPTRGIDVGAKAEIYALMHELARQGKSILMISSDLTEILRMSDRIMVMCEGRKTAEIPIEEATQEKIMHAATLREARRVS